MRKRKIYDITLKLCPFCGNKAIAEVYNNYDFETIISIGCANDRCFCRYKKNLWLAPKDIEIKNNITDMVEKWNERSS